MHCCAEWTTCAAGRAGVLDSGPVLVRQLPGELAAGRRRLGGNIQVITVPDGWPIWTSEVRPGREHDITELRTHPEMARTP